MRTSFYALSFQMLLLIGCNQKPAGAPAPAPQAREPTRQLTELRPSPDEDGIRWNIPDESAFSKSKVLHTVTLDPEEITETEQSKVRNSLEEIIRVHLERLGQTPYNPNGVPSLFVLRQTREFDRTVRVQVIEYEKLTPDCIHAIQEGALSKYPLWRIYFDCKETEEEPDLVVYLDAVATATHKSPPDSLVDVVKEWHQTLQSRRDDWAGPLYRQTRYCMNQVPGLLPRLTPESPVVLLGVFDNCQGDRDKTTFWVMHLGGALDIGIYAEGIGIDSDDQKVLGHGKPDILLDSDGRVLPQHHRAPYATIVQWWMKEPHFEFPMGRYTQTAPGRYYVLEGRWPVKTFRDAIVSDEQLRELEAR